jgi:uncharacterized protein
MLGSSRRRSRSDRPNDLILIRVDDTVYDTAADLEPPELRTLDAIHLSAALSLRPDLAGVVTTTNG